MGVEKKKRFLGPEYLVTRVIAHRFSCKILRKKWLEIPHGVCVSMGVYWWITSQCGEVWRKAKCDQWCLLNQPRHFFFFAPPKMFKILKNESWFSEKLFELNLKSMESLKFFQKITSKTHIENTPKKKQKKKSVFSENWSNARCTSKYHFFAEISQKLHAL